MNATEDGTEPLGEFPPHCDSLWCLITHPQTPPVVSEVERLRAVIAEVRALHAESTFWKNCCECHAPWSPSCPTVAILDRAGL